jgi:hypothetical protein
MMWEEEEEEEEGEEKKERERGWGNVPTCEYVSRDDTSLSRVEQSQILTVPSLDPLATNTLSSLTSRQDTAPLCSDSSPMRTPRGLQPVALRC